VPYITFGTNPFDPAIAGDHLYWPEGEKDVDATTRLGFLAFTFGGTGDGLPVVTRQYLENRDVVILADKDAGGHKHAQAKAALAHGVARSVRVIEFPEKDISDWIAQGHTDNELTTLTDAAPLWVPPAPEKSGDAERPEPPKDDTASIRPIKFKLVPFDELKSSETTNYLVKGMFPRRGIAIVWGPPKCGKSFWVFTVAMHVALGLDYRGHRVHQGEIVYLALEGQSGFGNRADAFRKHFLEPGDKVPAFKLSGASLDLVKDHAQLVDDIRRQSAVPACVVIDTMNRSLVGSENEAKDMAAYLRAADEIREAFDCLVIIIHHCGIDGSRPRGHTSQTGAADVQISVNKDTAKNVIAKVELAKDMAEGATFASRLEEVQLGRDQDDDLITSCVVIPIEDGAAVKSPKARKPSKLTAIALRALKKAIDECGAVPPASNHVPPKVKTVSIAQWRKYAYAFGISDGADRAKQLAFKKAREQAIADQLVVVWEEQVWFP
jgi:hypothetical protein